MAERSPLKPFGSSPSTCIARPRSVSGSGVVFAVFQIWFSFVPAYDAKLLMGSVIVLAMQWSNWCLRRRERHLHVAIRETRKLGLWEGRMLTLQTL